MVVVEEEDTQFGERICFVRGDCRFVGIEVVGFFFVDYHLT